MDLSTRYLGLTLPHPLMCGASPLADDLDVVRRLEDAGTAAVVLRSLFEEQLTAEQQAASHFVETPAESFAEALSYFPAPASFAFGPEEYLEHLRRVKAAVTVPVIGSLNGTSEGAWIDYATLIEQAGADALELNLYHLASDPFESGAAIEERLLHFVAEVKSRVRIPVAVKLSPFYTSTAWFGHQLEARGADGLVLFNRFYQADIDVEELEVERTLRLSTSNELLLRLRWLAILSGRLKISLAVSGGVHTVVDAVKAVMSGASAVQMVSSLLQQGPEHLATIRRQLEEWLVEHEYDSLTQMCGSMNLAHCPDPSAYERANYLQILQSLRV